MSEILAFEVKDFDPLLSDVHNALALSLHYTAVVDESSKDNVISNNGLNIISSSSTCSSCNKSNESVRVKWKGDMGNNFYNAISQVKIDHLKNVLDNMSQSNDLVKADIDSVAVQISSMFFRKC